MLAASWHQYSAAIIPSIKQHQLAHSRRPTVGPLDRGSGQICWLRSVGVCPSLDHVPAVWYHPCIAGRGQLCGKAGPRRSGTEAATFRETDVSGRRKTKESKNELTGGP